MLKTPLFATFAICTLTFSASAGTPIDGRIDRRPVTSVLDDVWDAPTLVKDKKSDMLNELRIAGRFQGDLFDIENNKHDDSGAEVVKMRLGIDSLWFKKLRLHVEADLDPNNGNEMDKHLTDAYLSYEFSRAFEVTLGKQPVHFTLDGGTSSNELLTLDRSQIWNNVWSVTEFFNGARVGGKKGNWEYSAGYFTAGNRSREFGTFSGSNFLVASLGYDFADALHAREAVLRLDYVNSEHREDGESNRRFGDIASLSFQLDKGRYGVSTDLVYATGHRPQGDVWGASIMPWYNITPRLQAVLRGTYMKSDSRDGLRVEHYDEVFARGDTLREVYAGLNYYFYGHRLKLQSGISYANLNASPRVDGDYHEWTFTTGLRVSW